MHKDIETKFFIGDSLRQLKKLDDNSVNLIMTSPPYADQRSRTYGGVSPDKYVEWFLPIAEQLKRVLRDDGTFILNIKERVVEGERHTYVLELIQALRSRGWIWTEELIWHKKNSHPGKWPNRFRDGWERLLQFNLNRKFAMYQDEVMVPLGDWHKSRFKNLREIDKRRDDSKVNSGFGKNVSNWVGRDMVYPDNVLHLATESSNKSHSAVYPETLPDWFIRLFTKELDVVLDPFVGSGTTSVAALKLNRHSIGIDMMPEYIEYAIQRTQKISGIVSDDSKKKTKKKISIKREILPVYSFSDAPLIPSADTLI